MTAVRGFLAAGSGYAVRNALGTEANHTGNDPLDAGSWRCQWCAGC
jgi:hypothetical protein